jgi:hypothetical protein
MDMQHVWAHEEGIQHCTLVEGRDNLRDSERVNPSANVTGPPTWSVLIGLYPPRHARQIADFTAV